MTLSALGRRLGSALVLCLVPVLGGAQSMGVANLPGMSAEWVDDPVLGGRLARYSGGNSDGPTVVLIHGIGKAGVRDWDHLIPELLDDYRVLALDLPGFGASEGGNRRYNPDSYVAVVRDLVADRSTGPVILIGHSMGGAVALRYAGTHPGSVKRVLLASVPGLLNPSSYLDFLVRLGDAQRPDGEMMPQAEGSLDALIGRVSRRLTRHVPGVDRILESENLRQVVLGGEPTRIAGFALAQTDFTETLPAIRAPVSLLWGTDDRIAPRRNARLLAALLHPGDLTLLEGVAHVPMKEDTERFNRWVHKRLHGEIEEATLPQRASGEPGDRSAYCDGRDGYTLSGDWDHITLRGCRNVVLEQVSARRITIVDSTVRIEAPMIMGEDVGLALTDSQVMLTAGRVEGDVAVSISGGHLDVAGTVLDGRTTAVRVESGPDAEISFSMTRLLSQGWAISRHAVVALKPGETL